MAQHTFDQASPSRERADGFSRTWKLLVRVMAGQCVVVATIAAALHEPVISVIVIVIGAVTVSLWWRYALRRHRALIADTADERSGDEDSGALGPFGPFGTPG